ncbi:bifunctional sterol desaturase/short chain dehydrogenase [Oscillatoria sp. FACHB-1406]|uniref:bifunctional sterol desaturase/short chain dehydrogenase n=1 Tax=Oscillatoria sp. FACHB-1406 TaxID=2692846 RepID=UPI00168468A9|nr:bifunctional sterol desaturase/short chain dehydrogenase [Oscillatoria sp. FACHB-1406]MBD2577472.1 bifunctional sterol desaturase/short chain dehydrogenase [Oscillatoria sp. FACHB-1406]
MIAPWLATASIGLISILWAEVVRDLYHLLAHYWSPLGRLHNWHHRVFRPDLTPASEAIYRQAHWYNDVPEALVMLLMSGLPVAIAFQLDLPQPWLAGAGSLYTLSFLSTAIARGLGIAGADELTDLTHRPGAFTEPPAPWFVNRTYHWRHHFDNQNAYYCGTLTAIDKIMGTALSLKGKRIAVTGASGSLGKSLLFHLQKKGAKVIALTSQDTPIALPESSEPIQTVVWQAGKEAELSELFEKVDILILNHGINVNGERTPDAIAKSYEINAFSQLRLLELFLTTVRSNKEIATKEVWVNTSEAESNPAFSPLYELSKRTLGDLVTLRRLDAPCTIRKLILGPFKSNLNPIGIMSADWVAKQVVSQATRDARNIIVTINPLTFVTFPLKEFSNSLYFRLFSRGSLPDSN